MYVARERSITLIVTIAVLSAIMVSSVTLLPLASAKNSGIGGRLNIPKDLITPPNQSPSIPKDAVAGSDIPKNLIVGPSCINNCPQIIGTDKDDVIYGVPVTDSIIYGLKGDDIITGGSGNTKLYGGSGNDEIKADVGNAQIYGGTGDDVLFGGTGTSIIIGGPGNDQLYSGTGADSMIGGPGADFFNCGATTTDISANAVILDFTPSEGDTKAANCKYVITSGSNGVGQLGQK